MLNLSWFVPGLKTLSNLLISPTPTMRPLSDIACRSSYSPTSYGARIHKVDISLLQCLRRDLLYFELRTTTLLIKVSMRQIPSFHFDFGGLICELTSPGLLRHVDFANYIKFVMCSFHQLSLSPLPSSPRYTSTPCTYPSQAVFDTSYKVDVR